MKRGAIAGTAAVAIAVGVAACAAPAEEAGPSAITIAVPAISFLDAPYTSIAGWEMQTNAIFEPLIFWNPVSNEADPVLAESLSWSEDRKTLTVHLRDGVEFSDGTVLDAEAAKQYLDAVLFDETFFALPTLEAAGLEFVVVDDMTLDFRADIPINDSMWLNIGIGSPTAYLAAPEEFKEHPVGTGPYLLDEFVPEVSATLVRNPDYWNPDAVEFDSVTFEIFVDPIASLNALKSGQIDVASIPSNYVTEAEDSGLSLSYPAVYGESTFLAIYSGSEAIPALGDVRVRQAIAMSFDRESIRETIQNGLGGASPQVFNEGHPAHVEGGDDRYAFDLDKARDLMAEAGYEDGFDLVIPKLAEGANPQYSSELEPVIVQALSDINIRVSFELVDVADWGTPDSTYPVLYFKQGPGAIFIYASGLGAGDWSGMIDEHGRELLQTIKEGTLKESDAAWAEFGEYSYEQAWFIAVTQPPSGIYATTPGLAIDMAAFHGGGSIQLRWIHVDD
jgi:peptide/nickel transport system substrate-binding protein